MASSKDVRELKEELADIREKEARILSGLEEEKQRDAVEQKVKKGFVKHFTFLDFCQSAIGVGVFGISAIVDPDIWQYVENVELRLLIYMHVFFVMAFVVAVNYEFRNSFDLDFKFLRNLIKRLFFVYISVVITVVFLLILIKRIGFDMTNYEVLKSYFIGQSVGLMGAITFSFFKK